LDFTDEQTISQAAKDFGSRALDILINCAGDLNTLQNYLNSFHLISNSLTGLYYLWDDKPFTDQSADDLLDHFKVNVIVRLLLSIPAGTLV
jgi:NAD(P)-dependent dehydrogenase (short-subunit alcohol dehydrogenase family)